MGNGYSVPSGDEIGRLLRLIQSCLDRLRELERPTGTQLSSTVATLQELVEGLIEQDEVNVSGDITAGGKLFVGDWYNNNITGSGGYHVAYVSIDGEAGYVPSSIAVKQDVTPATIDPDAVLGIDVVRFRYKNAVEKLGDEAAVEVGVIAEQVADQGLSWLLDTDPDGTPVGFKYERLALALLPVVQSLAARVAALES